MAAVANAGKDEDFTGTMAASRPTAVSHVRPLLAMKIGVGSHRLNGAVDRTCKHRVKKSMAMRTPCPDLEV